MNNLLDSNVGYKYSSNKLLVTDIISAEHFEA